MKDPEVQKEIETLVQGLLLTPNNLDLIDQLAGIFEPYDVKYGYGEEQIVKLGQIKEGANSKNASRLALLEAELTLEHWGSNVAWQVLYEAIIKDPQNNDLLVAIEALNECPGDAPTFADGMETIAREVAAGTFPRDVFEYLVVALQDPECPDCLDLALEIAGK